MVDIKDSDINVEDIPLEEILRKERLASSFENTNRNKKKGEKVGFERGSPCNSDKISSSMTLFSKNLPTQVSSRRQTLPDKLLNERNHINNKYRDKNSNDPRFRDSSGALNMDLFHKSYNFIDDLRKNEFESIKNILDLHKSMNKAKELGNWNRIKKLSKFKNSNITQYTQEEIDELKLQLQKLVSENDCRRNLYLRQKAISLHRKQEQINVEKGKKPFYIKQKDIDLTVQHEKYKLSNRKQKYRYEKKLNKKLSSKFKLPTIKVDR